MDPLGSQITVAFSRQPQKNVEAHESLLFEPQFVEQIGSDQPSFEPIDPTRKQELAIEAHIGLDEDGTSSGSVNLRMGGTTGGGAAIAERGLSQIYCAERKAVPVT